MLVSLIIVLYIVYGSNKNICGEFSCFVVKQIVIFNFEHNFYSYIYTMDLFQVEV